MIGPQLNATDALTAVCCCDDHICDCKQTCAIFCSLPRACAKYFAPIVATASIGMSQCSDSNNCFRHSGSPHGAPRNDTENGQSVRTKTLRANDQKLAERIFRAK